jgi:pyruvate formate lyase activating enzyme
MAQSSPLIFDIHRFALDDGPGIRTTVFFKGCLLSCCWCHNPESISTEPQIAVYTEKCINCGACRDECTQGAIISDAPVHIDRKTCTACGKCAEICPAKAIEVAGRNYSVDELLEIIMRDKDFYDASEGGVTFSGGEPTLRMDYLEAVLRALKAAGVHTAIQTCGMFDFAAFSKKVLPFIDLIMFDIKIISSKDHQKYTGCDNHLILENFRRLTKEAGEKILPRTPLVPKLTATPANLSDIASFLAEQRYIRHDFLPFNNGGIEKRKIFGMAPPPYIQELKTDIEEEK